MAQTQLIVVKGGQLTEWQSAMTMKVNRRQSPGYVELVDEGSPPHKAGFRTGMRMTQFNGNFYEDGYLSLLERNPAKPHLRILVDVPPVDDETAGATPAVEDVVPIVGTAAVIEDRPDTNAAPITSMAELHAPFGPTDRVATVANTTEDM